MSVRVLVVDDSAAFGRVMKLALESIAGVEVAGLCRSGDAALERMRIEAPDLVTLDVEMPGKNGLDVLMSMRRDGIRSAAVMVSSASEGARELTMRALQLGALDFVPKPQSGGPDENLELLRERLAPLIGAAAHRKEVHTILRGGPCSVLKPHNGERSQPPLRWTERPVPFSEVPVEDYGKRPVHPGSASQVPADALRPLNGTPRGRLLKPVMVLIGVSTGGPEALGRIVPALPAALPVPVLIVQHMPPLFTQTLAEKLDSISKLRVKEAENGETALPGRVYLAPGGSHLKVAAGRRHEIVLRISGDPPENNCRPAVDVLFRSAAAAFPGHSVAVILTGMGRDGTLGLRDLYASGVVSIAQDELTSTVFGMPKEAIQAGLIDIVSPLSAIASEIVKAAG